MAVDLPTLPGLAVDVTPCKGGGWHPDNVIGDPARLRRVHVMSSHAGGEIRSYWLTEDNVLWVAGPAHAGRWDDADAAVAAALGARVRPYDVGPGGAVTYLPEHTPGHQMPLWGL